MSFYKRTPTISRSSFKSKADRNGSQNRVKNCPNSRVNQDLKIYFWDRLRENFLSWLGDRMLVCKEGFFFFYFYIYFYFYFSFYIVSFFWFYFYQSVNEKLIWQSPNLDFRNSLLALKEDNKVKRAEEEEDACGKGRMITKYFFTKRPFLEIQDAQSWFLVPGPIETNVKKCVLLKNVSFPSNWTFTNKTHLLTLVSIDPRTMNQLCASWISKIWFLFDFVTELY